MKRRTFVAGLGAALAAPAVSRAAPAISDNLIKLGVLTDMSGMYSDGTGPGSVRGLMVHDMALMQVKTPAESKGEWDLYNVIGDIPGADAFPPFSPDCPLVAGKMKG